MTPRCLFAVLAAAGASCSSVELGDVTKFVWRPDPPPSPPVEAQSSDALYVAPPAPPVAVSLDSTRDLADARRVLGYGDSASWASFRLPGSEDAAATVDSRRVRYAKDVATRAQLAAGDDGATFGPGAAFVVEAIDRHGRVVTTTLVLVESDGARRIEFGPRGRRRRSTLERDLAAASEALLGDPGALASCAERWTAWLREARAAGRLTAHDAYYASRLGVRSGDR